MSLRLLSSVPSCAASIEPLRAVLAEAVAWCEARASAHDPRESLRRLPDPVDVEDRGHLGLAPANLVRAVQWQRAKALKAAGLEVPELRWGVLPGRLLVLFPDEETADGGAEAQSEGFFDVHNTPPWDTWVGYFDDLHETPTGPMLRSYLLAYVPQAFVARAARGIAANPEQAIQWLEGSDTALAALLRREAS